MEFWAVEVKSGETSKVVPGDDMVLHLSQASLGEIKKGKGNENVNIFVNADEKKLVLATLSSERLPQQQFDLVFDTDFELSHNWKGGSVYFFGYKAANDFGQDEDASDFEVEEDLPLELENNGKPETKVKEEKAVDVKKSGKDSATEKKKVNQETTKETANVLTKIEGSEDGDSDDDSISDEDTDMDEDDEDDSEGEDDSSEEEEPAKPVPGKKRSSEADLETPASKKKAKFITPQKTDAKKGGVHVATPHPAKQAGKASATQNTKSPKSTGGSHVCKSCSRSFGTEGALDSHSKAKHSDGK